ncbi:MAG: acyl-CoA dehydrogenase protein, partial [Microbacteriaceae bacterium]|nr:acyl-CoA dehydrogenase protein [Microbacteriaceae bacterium]
MDLTLSEPELAFRDELVAWAASVTPPEGLVDYGSMPTTEQQQLARQWQRILFDGGWAGMSWPVEFGGRGASLVEQAIYAEEMASLGLPRGSNITSLELAGPMIYQFGTEAQKQHFLPRILRGDDLWVQLFSEPGAGSDLASLSTKATQEGDGWRITGQKIWSSGGHFADLGLLLARTGPPGHGGITCFLLPMDREGITARPIVQLNGERKFSEVFFDEVRVEAADVLGEVDSGWSVAVSTLGRERLTLGSHAVTQARALDKLAAFDRAVDPDGLGVRFAELYSRIDLLRLTWFRLLTSGMPISDPRTSILKMISSDLDR